MHNSNGHNHQKDDDNIIALPSLAERERARKEKERKAIPPIINLPPLTKWLCGIMLALYILTGVVLPPDITDFIIMNAGFIPANLYGEHFTPLSVITPITHMFLHGSWMHVLMNVFMLAAFGSGIERWIGTKKTLMIFIISGLFGATAHFLLNTQSIFPMIGASGGLSGLFAAAIMMMRRGQREIGGRFGILPFALIWIGLSIGFGMLGGPDGSMIAWAAHVGGFLGGFAALKILKI